MLNGEASDAAEPIAVGGKSIPRHQLDFALALGCRAVICLGDGGASTAISLRHAAEAGGARFQAIRGVRELPAAVRGDDQLLVLARGLLPESPYALALLLDTYGILVLPAEAGWGAGFERLDLTAAWGGAMLLPGRLVAQLDELSEDAEPIAGLLRIARQAGVPERPLPESELAEGRWQIVRNREAAHALEPMWLRRRLPAVSPFRPTTWLAALGLRKWASGVTGGEHAVAFTSGISLLVIAGAVGAAWFGLSWVAFAALAFAALAIETSEGLLLLRRSVFAAETKSSRSTFILRVIWDVALIALGTLAIDATRAERLFPPLVTAGLLRSLPPWPEKRWRALAGDRGTFAAVLALAAAIGLTEGAFMVLALLLILLRVAPAAEQRG
jgi:hypothetical protein